MHTCNCVGFCRAVALLCFTDVAPDPCSAFGLLGLAKCFHIFGYGNTNDNLPFRCRLLSFEPEHAKYDHCAK